MSATTTASPANPARPAILASVYTTRALDAILRSLRAGKRPLGSQTLVGHYGINASQAEAIKALPGARYAPMFGLDSRDPIRVARRLSPAEKDRVDPRFGGRIPSGRSDARLPPTDQRAWGLELGRRFRDELRRSRRQGIRVDAWQFDEIVSQCAMGSATRPWRLFVGNVMWGLAYGRPELGDRHESGFVWMAWNAITRLPRMRITRELELFWHQVDAASRFLVGEEYPAFTGDPARAARQYAAPHRSLASSTGPIRRGLGRRYIAAMTPGWKLAPGLGGNVNRWPRARVNQWRNAFIGARVAAQRPVGHGQFSFDGENARSFERIKDAIDALLRAAALDAAGAGAFDQQDSV
jgi:hypothetical protein